METALPEGIHLESSFEVLLVPWHVPSVLLLPLWAPLDLRGNKLRPASLFPRFALLRSVAPLCGAIGFGLQLVPSLRETASLPHFVRLPPSRYAPCGLGGPMAQYHLVEKRIETAREAYASWQFERAFEILGNLCVEHGFLNEREFSRYRLGCLSGDRERRQAAFERLGGIAKEVLAWCEEEYLEECGFQVDFRERERW